MLPGREHALNTVPERGAALTGIRVLQLSKFVKSSRSRKPGEGNPCDKAL